MHKVTFQPSGITIETTSEENLLRAAMRAGIHINASCGGAGVCNKCRIFLEKGRLKGDELPDGGWRACTSYALSDLEIRVPVESEMDRKALNRPLARKAASWMQSYGQQTIIKPAPIISKTVISLPPPSISDSISDLERLQRELAQGQLQGKTIEVDSQILKTLPISLREAGWQVTVSLMDSRHPATKRLVKVEASNNASSHLAVAFDLGTTTISGQLVDLNTTSVLAEASNYNPQVSYGEDVISRMEFAKKGDGLSVLQAKVVECLNGIIDELCRQTGTQKDDIGILTLAANTVMTHFLLGLETKFLRAHPYIPVATQFPPIRASELGFSVPEHVRLFAAPCVASYVGGDIMAGVVGIGLHKKPELTLFIDIGTNGEIVLGNQDWMACAACSAGPAFEGGGIKHGMRATTGAIEVVHVHSETYEPMALTIGGKKAKGICGSGIISLLAGLFMTGALDKQGKFRHNLPTDRIREGRDGWEYVVVRQEATATGEDIVFTEADVENLIRAKGAMFAGYVTLLESVGMAIEDLERIVLAGNFGSYLDLEQAVTIGFLPDIPRERFFFAGNTSLLGAKAAALSKEVMMDMKTVAQMMTHFDLSENPRFMEHYVSSMFLPHTDSSLFPSVIVQ